MKEIAIKSANTHNLKNISLNIPRNKFVVITGPSGSGKSSLAFDTIFQEGQRRYLESLTTPGAPFMQQLPPVNVESIKGLSPTLCLDQKSSITNRRSTVGTITEIYDYLRILFAKCAVAHSPESGLPIAARSENEIVDEVISLAKNKKIMVLYPAIKEQKGAHREVLNKAESLGYHSFRINGVFYSAEDTIRIDKNVVNNIDIVVDRIVVNDQLIDKKERFQKSVTNALTFGKGSVIIHLVDEKKDFYFSDKYYCPVAKKSYPTPHPVMFSFNSPRGQCPECLGLGYIDQIDEDKIIESTNVALDDQPRLSQYLESDDLLKAKIEAVFKKNKVAWETNIKDYSASFKMHLFYGKEIKGSNFLGIIPYIAELINDTSFENSVLLNNFTSSYLCQTCRGNRLLPYPLAFKYLNKSISDISNMSIFDLYNFFGTTTVQNKVGILNEVETKLKKEIYSRSKFLLDVGLSYLTLNRVANSLSGGELQRIRLASQLGSKLSGVIYILDEPSIGLHQRDNLKLINTLKNLRDLGNSILVVEHDEETMRLSDHIIDIGPGAGEHGGTVLFNGHINDLLKTETTTANYLSKKESIQPFGKPRDAKGHITLKNSKLHNLKDVTLDIPLGCFVAITGVSGSGKSTLIHQELVPQLKKYFLNKTSPRLTIDKAKLDDLNAIDQKPIGRSPKSIPLSYCGIFDNIRQLFANTMNAKLMGLTPSHFSFNVKVGRCPKCEGNGALKFEMPYLSESYIPCPVCLGKRFNQNVLSVRYRGLSIDDVLNLTVEHACEFFANHNKIHHTLKTMNSIGLGYLRLGQSSTTLSGGEAQRIKLAKSLSKIKKGHVLYILDEPTTGLHFQDIKLLLTALNGLVDQGNTVVVIEHNLDLIKCADHIIDLGPDGGNKGGEIVGVGNPKALMKNQKSLTGYYLKKLLEN